jgi:hypothetical protein
MTKLLEKAFKKASQIPEIEQNTLARWLMEELEADRKWEQMFAKSEDVLGVLADEALDDFNKGKTKILDLKEL